ncbi:hypothetical protein BH09PAT3_BH09PAT3_3880 [soil metagenome]
MKKQAHSKIINQDGKVYIKIFWLTSIILSVLLTLILNLLF